MNTVIQTIALLCQINNSVGFPEGVNRVQAHCQAQLASCMSTVPMKTLIECVAEREAK